MNIIELAKEVWHEDVSTMDLENLERFAALVRSEALEEAAKVCDTEEIHRGNWFAAAIRGMK